MNCFHSKLKATITITSVQSGVHFRSYSFTLLFAGVAFLKNLKQRILMQVFKAKIKSIYDKNSSFKTLLAIFESANSRNREYQEREYRIKKLAVAK